LLVILAFLKSTSREAVGIDDQDAAGLEIAHVGLEGGRVHGDQNVDCVAGSVDFGGREVHLEAGHAGEGALRCSDLGGEVGEGGEVIPEEGRGVRELAPRDLHAISGVSAEADDRVLEPLAFDPAFCRGGSCCR
jgi:hypothetical protein